jgi:hypothetical protein
MEERHNRGEKIGHLIGDLIGFFWLLLILSGTFGLGAAVAHYSVGDNHRDAAGLLAALAVIWLNERQNSEHRWRRMNETFDALFERLPR